VKSSLVVAALALTLLACTGTGVHSAETLTTPFPGVIVSATPTHEKCRVEGCRFEYLVRISNPTDVDANVQTCTLAAHRQTEVPVQGIAGADVPPHRSTTVLATNVLPYLKGDVKALVGQRLSCTGLDWHGNPPI
jgi:hypothetical protein